MASDTQPPQPRRLAFVEAIRLLLICLVVSQHAAEPYVTTGGEWLVSDPASSDLTNTRAPSLRDLVQGDGTENGPFFHDGSAATLADVIEHYDVITAPTDPDARAEFLATIDQRLVTPGGDPLELNLTAGEKDQLIAFLKTLAGDNVYTDEKYSDPF